MRATILFLGVFSYDLDFLYEKYPFAMEGGEVSPHRVKTKLPFIAARWFIAR